jgi:RNA polymerase sigma factor (sigma-70 family)
MTATTAERPAAFDARVMAYMPGLRNLSYKLEKNQEIRNDLVTDTIIEALDKWQNFREDGGMWNWLYWTMRGRICNQRKLKKLHIVDSEFHYDTAAVQATQDDHVELSQVLDMMATREGGILLRRAMGEKLREIGEDLGISRERTRQIEEEARAMVVKRSSRRMVAA